MQDVMRDPKIERSGGTPDDYDGPPEDEWVEDKEDDVEDDDTRDITCPENM